MSDFGEIIIYQTEDGLTNIDVKFEDDTVWFTQQQMANMVMQMEEILRGVGSVE